MTKSRGKQFEDKFAENWTKTFPGGLLLRLHDQLSGYKTVSKNPCDYIAYNNGKFYMIECKSHKGASLPVSDIPQYETLLSIANENKKGVRVGIVVWLIEKDKVYYVPIKTIQKILGDNIKSINPEKVEAKGYSIFNIPSNKLRVFMNSDYSIMEELEDGD